MVTLADVRAAFRQFQDLTDAQINTAIAAATPFFNDPARYGDFLVRAQLVCVAHFVVSYLPDQGLDRGANDATAETRPTISFQRSPELLRKQAHDPFMRTNYGQEFCYYRDRAGMGGVGAVLSAAASAQLQPAPGLWWW